MTAPVLVFDHINKRTMTIERGSKDERKLAEIEAAQRKQVSSATGRPLG